MQDTLTIGGMSCAHCVRAVEEALRGLPGVTVHQVEIGAAQITRDPHRTPDQQLAEALEAEGFTLNP
ncbi:MAG: heavy-metal-associated domain-containing protein [Bacteroidota bacterium]